MRLLLRNGFQYHLRKPRVVTSTDLAYNNYKASLKQARKAIHKEAYNYLEQIEDAYLEQHHQQMKNKHFEFQCGFRKEVFTDAYRLQQNQIRWQKRDDDYRAILNKHLHDQDIKKINRSRIIKIMEHQSSNYWFNSQNVDQRLQNQTIFPQYIASSQYYYKLHAEALAYETGDFKELHAVSSSEETIREKNKYLIPHFLTLRTKIANFKKDEIKEARQKNIFELNLVKTNPNLSPKEVEELTSKLESNLQKQLEEIESRKQKLGKLTQLKLKIKDIISIFKTWKEYTNILALTSAQVLRNTTDVTGQLEIQKTEKEVLKGLSSKLHQTFIDSIQEDTEEVEMSFQQYLTKINQSRKERQVDAGQSLNVEDLDSLMSSSQEEPQEQADIIKQGIKGSEYTRLAENTPAEASELAVGVDEEEINPLFMNERETTASVQILKQHYKEDGEMLALLNQLGQIDVRYPKLFQNIWQSIH